ncbi:putative receptor-like protein kinase At5g39000 [Lactuca sativa]|uniref:putative receptor-like protein kinase At5g39000 n=1 Tax=Lactuca sativa TaxID=4236 RepID=UPI000CD9588E|nr:putative receptor-like protein kinase At5g39000 [Lactuca sativa]
MSLIREWQHLCVPFRDIEIATRNFKTIIGKGGYGDVYKGELLLSGKLTSVAVKRLPKTNHSGQGLKEFLTEIQLLSRYEHPNLVSLLGYCEEHDEKILIYEYAEHGSLDCYLSMSNTRFPVPWKQRINICIDAARGLDYLHNHVAENHRVIHRDIKSSNILLDHNWKAMISDLGLSKIGRANENESYLITNLAGTHGYCDPAYINTGILTKESDVYSFGVVLFEVLCGRPVFMNVNNERRFLTELVKTCYKKGNFNDIIDLDLKKQMDSDSLNMVSKIAYQCLEDDRKQRPSMGLVVEKLEKALELQELSETWAPNVPAIHKRKLQILSKLAKTSAENAETCLSSMACVLILIFLLIMDRKQLVITRILLILLFLFLLLLLLLFLLLFIRTLCTFVFTHTPFSSLATKSDFGHER